MKPVSKSASEWLDYGIANGKFSDCPSKEERRDIIKILKEVFSISTRRAQECVYDKFGRAADISSVKVKEPEKKATDPKQLDLLNYRKHTEARIPTLTDEISRRLFRTAIADYAAHLKKLDAATREDDVYARFYGYVKDGTTKTFNTRSKAELAEAALVIHLRTDFLPFLDVYNILSGKKEGSIT